MRRLLRPLWFLLALIFLLEAWLWSHLAPLVGWVVERIAWARLKQRVAVWIEVLPPSATLLVFLVPAALLLPVKLLGLWFLAHGWWFSAMALLVGAKIVSTGITAFIFDVTRPKLLQIAWFRWLYDHVMTGLAWAHRMVDPFKARIRAFAHETFGPIRRRMRKLFWLLRPRRSGRFIRRIMRIRRRVQQV